MKIVHVMEKVLQVRSFKDGIKKRMMEKKEDDVAWKKKRMMFLRRVETPMQTMINDRISVFLYFWLTIKSRQRRVSRLKIII